MMNAEVRVADVARATPLADPRVEAVIARMEAERRRPSNGGPVAMDSNDPNDYADFGFSIHPSQGELIYLLCRALRAKRVVDFATSVGFSALYFAAAIRDNGGGEVIGAEIVPRKIEVARANLAEAGLDGFVESVKAMHAGPCAMSAATSISP